MKRKVSFVAVGQAAGNIGQLLEGKGYAVIYVNTSQEDLDTLEGAKFQYHIPKGEGCNKDRRKAKQLVIEDFDNIFAEIEAKAKADMVFVVFASGGGTGSGAGPMLADLLIGEGKSVGVVTVIPSSSESVKSQINSYECFAELVRIEGTGACFIIDNNKGDKLELNNAFVDSLDAFLGIPGRHKSVRGNIDKAEAMETLNAHGMAAIIRSGGKGSADIIQAAQGNALAPLEPDRAVKYIAASFAGEARMEDLEKAFGTPIDNFQTYNGKETICCLSGLAYPQTRMGEVYAKVEANKDLIKKNLAATMESGMKGSVNFLDGMQKPKDAGARKPQSKRDIMNKYL